MRIALAALLFAAQLGAQRPRSIDVVDYDLTLTLPDAGSTIDGVAVLTVRRLARGGQGPRADTLALDLLDLTVKSVRVGERDAVFTHAETVMPLLKFAKVPVGAALAPRLT